MCSLIGDFGFDVAVNFLAADDVFLGVCMGEVELLEFCKSPSFEFELCCWLTEFVVELNRTHSRDIPMAIHFLKRQCWQRFLFSKRIIQAPSFMHL